MRVALVILFFVAALWRAVIDWQATLAQGYAYRFDAIGEALAARWPEDFPALVRGAATRLPWAWDPVGAFLLSMPLAPVLALVAMSLWVTRNRGRSR